MVADLVLAVEVLTGDEVAAEETSGMVVRQEGMYLEEDTHLPEVADLNIQQQAMILDQNIIQVIYERKMFNNMLFDKWRKCI